MRRRLKSAGLWLLVLALAAGSMALPWMVCRGYDRELFAQPRTRPATDLALSAAARENGFVSQLYERQRLLGGWSEGWEPLEGEAAGAAAENVALSSRDAGGSAVTLSSAAGVSFCSVAAGSAGAEQAVSVPSRAIRAINRFIRGSLLSSAGRRPS